MGLKDSEIHVVAAIATPLLSGLLGVLFIVSTSSQRGCSSEDDKPEGEKYTVVEASIAMKKEKDTKQPVKKPNAPPPTKKEGVSHDEKKPPEKKKDEPKPIDNSKQPDFSQFKHPHDPDEPEHKAPQTSGDPGGALNGNAKVTKGDPYFQQLSADLDYTVPAIKRCEGTPPKACFKLSPEGKITRTEVKAQGDAYCMNDAAEQALKRLKTKRDETPVAVPENLKDTIASNLICFDPITN
jgi:hypothetical protein